MSDSVNWRAIYRRPWSHMKLKSEAKFYLVRDLAFVLLNIFADFLSSQADRKSQRPFYQSLPYPRWKISALG